MFHPRSQASLLLLPPSCSPARCVIQNPCVFRFPLASASPGLRAALAVRFSAAAGAGTCCCVISVFLMWVMSRFLSQAGVRAHGATCIRCHGRRQRGRGPCVLRRSVPASCPAAARSSRTAVPATLPSQRGTRSSQPRPRRKIRKRFLFNLYKNSQL